MSLLDLDPMLRDLLPPGAVGRRREVADLLLRHFPAPELEALLVLWSLSGAEPVVRWLGERLAGVEGRSYVRIRPGTKAQRRVVQGVTYEAGTWYNVSPAVALALAREPVSDLPTRPGVDNSLFEVSADPPVQTCRSEAPRHPPKFVL